MQEIKQIDNQIAKTKKTDRNVWSLVILIVIVASFFGAFFGFVAGSLGTSLFPNMYGGIATWFPLPQRAQEVPEKINTVQFEKIVEEDSAVINVVEKSSDAVVSIVITKDVPKFKNNFSNPFFEQFFGGASPFGVYDSGETEKQQVGGGTGFFVSADGMIITNKHVVEDLNAQYSVITSDGAEHQAIIVSRHPLLDLAILDIEGNGFVSLSLGDSEKLKVGQTVIAIGNSLGEFSNSVSRGIVSGLGRSILASSGYGRAEKLNNIIQTDAAINSGNSGGPLLNLHGDVIGVNVAMAQGAENVGFSLPINEVTTFIKQIEENGEVAVPFLGVRYVILNEQMKKENNLPVDHGALVLRGETMMDLAVVPGSPADKAGIVENDIILEINGEKITEERTLSEIIAEHGVGEELILKIWHKGDEKEVKVVLDKKQ